MGMRWECDGNAIVWQIPVHEKMEVCRHGVKRSDKIWLGPSWGMQKTLILCTPASGSALPLQALHSRFRLCTPASGSWGLGQG